MKKVSLQNKSFLSSIGIVILLFFFIFGIPTPIGSLTPLLTLGVILWAILNYKKYLLHIPKEVFYLFLFLLLDLVVCLVIPILFVTYDFSIIQTKINFMASILAAFVLAKNLSLNNNISEKRFFNLLLSVFAIQVTLIILMLLNADISQIITSFARSDDQGTRVLETYGGARGLGVADSSAFGLAIVMGLFIFISFFSYKNKFINLKYFILLILLGGIASVSAGRTAILGLVLGLLYLFLNFKNLRSFMTLISTFLLIILLGYLLLSIDRQSIQNETLGNFYSYSMEPILNYIATGNLASSSTDALYNMYFPLTEQQYLIGDGRYMEGQSYYMATDAGYMRFVLFYGGFFSLLLYGYFIYFVSKISFAHKKYLTLLLFCMSLSFLLHYKGEVVLFSISYNKVLFLILFYIYFDQFKKNRGFS